MKSRNTKKWGIIGDGQLARMLALEAYPLGLRPVVLTADPVSSAGQVCPLQVRGSIQSQTDLHALLAQVDFAVIESEFVNCDLLESTGFAEKVVPRVDAIRTLQNKLSQKKMLNRLGIATSPLHEKSTTSAQWLDDLLAPGQAPVVLKFATLGYDGKGVLVLNGNSQDRVLAENFCALAADRKIEVYAEDRVPFQKELAMIAVRGLDGEMLFYPLVISEQLRGICNRVMGPAALFGIPDSVEAQAQNICRKVAEDLDIVGVFGVEFFSLDDRRLLVNEIAPRVHNSGHYTQDAGSMNQFTNHWRAVTGMPLGSTVTAPFFAMQNILGPEKTLSRENAKPPVGSADVRVHWYNKSGISPGRKLGHLNVVGHSASEQSDLLSSLTASYARWQDEVKATIPQSPMELLK